MKLCRCQFLVPTLFPQDVMQEYIIKTIPPIKQVHCDYYFEHKWLYNTFNAETGADAGRSLILTFENGKNTGDGMQLSGSAGGKKNTVSDEPALYFHEFVFLLGLIAVNQMGASEATEPQDKIEAFFIERLQFNPVVNEKKNIMKFEHLLRK